MHNDATAADNQKIAKEEKRELRSANTSMNELIASAKKKGAFISEEIITKQPELFNQQNSPNAIQDTD